MERLSGTQLAALGIGISGAGLLVGGGGTEAGLNFLLGSSLALGAGFAYSLYAIITKGTLAGTPPLTMSALTFGVAALLLVPIIVARPLAAGSLLSRGWPVLLYLGAVPTALAHWLYASGLERMRASVAAVATLPEPLTTALLGVLLFGEPLGLAGAVGALLLLLAVTILICAGETS